MKEVTKTVTQYEIGDYVMLVKDTKFGSSKAKQFAAFVNTL